MARSLVTGGSGFIGSHVVDELLRVGHEVTVLDCGAQPHRLDVKFIDIDLTNVDRVLEAVRGHDYIFHLGAVSDVNLALQNPIHCAQVNVLGTINVLESARRSGTHRVILASSVLVYSGTPDGTRSESSPLCPPRAGPFYSSSKIAAELFCHDYWRVFRQPFTILRYGTVYGPRMREPLVIHNFITKALLEEPITIMGDGRQCRNFLYVEDLARAHSLVLTEKGVNQTFNLEGSRKITIREVAETISRVLNKAVVIEHQPGRPGDDMGIGVSITKVRDEVGWEPTVDLEEGIRRTIQWYRENL